MTKAGEAAVDDQEPQGSCVVCQRRDPFWPQVCDLCRSRLAARLWELRDLHALLPAALGKSQTAFERVSGSREAPVPLSVPALDLAAQARVPSLTNAYPGQVTDQEGHLGVATILNGWARDWAELNEERAPEPDVPALVSWLSVRLRWACNEHPAVDDFAFEVTTTLYAIRALLNVSQKPIYLDESCPTCGQTALRRDPGGGDVECGNCARTWRYEEFNRLAVVLASDHEEEAA